MSPSAGAADEPRLRIVSYNVHRCLGTDRVLDPGRIAEVIAGLEPDVVALQELDVGRLRSGNVDQARIIADVLRMQVHFHPAMRVLEELYGDAILTERPVRLARAAPLPHPPRGMFVEPRGALWITLDIGGIDLQIVNTHLGLGRVERALQVEALLGPDWLGHPGCNGPAVLVGDFNALPMTGAYRRLASAMQSARAPAAFPSRWPLLALDHAFVRGRVQIERCEVLRTPLARRASDHLPLVLDIRLLREPAGAPSVSLPSELVSVETRDSS
jgi:endonuclease/exonuclease/phosphatase family metal-dependent hydrolase